MMVEHAGYLPFDPSTKLESWSVAISSSPAFSQCNANIKCTDCYEADAQACHIGDSSHFHDSHRSQQYIEAMALQKLLLFGNCLTNMVLAAPNVSRLPVRQYSNSLAPGNSSASTCSGNPFADIQMYPNPYYRDEINNLAVPNMTEGLAAQAAQVAEIPTFQWLYV